MSGEVSRTPSLAEVMKIVSDKTKRDIFVARPGKIETYDPLRQVANILLCQMEPFADEDGGTGAEPIPVLMEIPVLFPGGGGYFMSFPLLPGDIGLVVFCDRSLDTYWASDGSILADPIDQRSHELSDAVFIPLKFGPQARAIKGEISSSAVFGKEKGFQVRVGETGIDITTAGNPTVIPGAPGSGYVAMANL
ncbi:MAG: Gp138 family membrane-puncturing spike protein, partial [Methylococcaceae bacterium]|nr:Gp138 family membrane-puncturing spike protein [Methylococcaceae bacterium]